MNRGSLNLFEKSQLKSKKKKNQKSPLNYIIFFFKDNAHATYVSFQSQHQFTLFFFFDENTTTKKK